MPTVNTDAQGIALFSALAAQQYRVDVVPPAGLSDLPDQTVTVANGVESQVAFPLASPTGSIRVTVTRLSDGSPVTGVAVNVTAVVP